MDEDITCGKCGLINSIHTEEKNGQILAYCDGCNAYIKNLAQGKAKLYIGKYKGKFIEDIDDCQYLEWCISVVKLSPRTKKAIQEQIQILKTKPNGNH